MTLDLKKAAAALRNAAGFAAIVLGSIPATDLPASVRAPLITVGGGLLVVEHGLEKIREWIGPPSAPAPAAPAHPPVAPPTNAVTNPFTTVTS